MHAWTPLILALSAAVAFAQNNKINIPANQNTLTVIAGQLTTITWSDPSSGTVTIKLQQAPNITPDSGYVLQSGIPASSLTASFTIPPTVNSHQYTIEIIDDTNPTNINFSPYFGIQGATGTQTALVGSTGTASASSASHSSASFTNTTSASAGSASASSSSASASSASASSGSASSASARSSSSGSSASASSSSARSSSASAAATSHTTSAPSSAATQLSIPGGFLAAFLGAAAFL